MACARHGRLSLVTAPLKDQGRRQVVGPTRQFHGDGRGWSSIQVAWQKDLGSTEFPAVETALIDGELAWRQHRGGHTTGPNWPTFLTFASRYIKTR